MRPLLGTAYDRLTAALEERTGYRAREGMDWRCPAHDDSTASLSVARKDDRVLIHCHAGCDTDQVLAALDLTAPDLFDAPPAKSERPRIVASYAYVDEDGGPLFKVHRFSPKTFRQQAANGEWKLNGTRRVLYRLPEIVRAVSAGQRIYVAEGEKDADAIVRAGAVATCNPMGAGKWQADYADSLAGARQVVIVADRDQPGYRHARTVARSLHDVAEVIVVQPVEGKDAADHLAAGHGLDEFQRIDLADLDRLCDDQPDVEGDDPDSAGDNEPTTWQPVDLTDALTGHDLPEPELLDRSDGQKLLYRGRVHWFQGESEACKSWLALIAVAQILNTGGHALWIDFEDDDRGVVARLLALGVQPDAIAGRFTYVRPDEPLKGRTGYAPGWVDLVHLIKRRYDLAVIDGVTEAMTVEGLNLLDNTDIAVWQRLLPKRIATVTGAAVVCIDHVTKNSGEAGRYAIGGQHKLAGVTGAAYRLEVRARFKRAETQPVEGRIAITVTKDRPGWVRSHATDDAIGVLVLTSWPDGGVTAEITTDRPGADVDLNLCRRILDHLVTYDGSSGRKVEEAVDGKAATIRQALKWMIDEPRRWIRVEKVGVAHFHYLTDAGREEFNL